tara:strand:- start:631 stop:765 length:135 start_codon:yes stop_codon:yes gene_type:complete
MKTIVKLSKKIMSDEELALAKNVRPGKLAKKLERKEKKLCIMES